VTGKKDGERARNGLRKAEKCKLLIDTDRGRFVIGASSLRMEDKFIRVAKRNAVEAWRKSGTRNRYGTPQSYFRFKFNTMIRALSQLAAMKIAEFNWRFVGRREKKDYLYCLTCLYANREIAFRFSLQSIKSLRIVFVNSNYS